MHDKHIPRRQIDVKNHAVKFGASFKDGQLYPKIREAQQVMRRCIARHPSSYNSRRKR